MTAQSLQPATIHRDRVAQIIHHSQPPQCLLANGTKASLSPILAVHISPGDTIAFPVLTSALPPSVEIYVARNRLSGGRGDLYQAAIGYVTQPKQDKRGEFFVAAEAVGHLGISSISIPCQALREYFYRISSNDSVSDRRTLYEVLRMPSIASFSELRVGFKLRQLELQAEDAPHSEHVLLERAFNIVAEPELRACYDALLADPEVPAVFPYGGFGSLLVSGETSHDGKTFFARRIVSFLPELRQRRFRAPLRKCDFYSDRALYHDARRKLELWIDHAVLHKTWNAAWNQWKHLLATKMEVSATFVRSGKFRKHQGQWRLLTWETALPSRLEVKLPADFPRHVETAGQTYYRFGQYSAALERVRLKIQHQAVERDELNRILSILNVPGDFDAAQISWQPDYDRFFYRQLSRRARRIYLFRDEYIFDLERAVVVETPQLGHATYIFAKPRKMESFLALYTKVSKDDIRRNRNNAAEQLGFLGRVVHGTNPRQWVRELKTRVGEGQDLPAVLDSTEMSQMSPTATSQKNLWKSPTSRPPHLRCQTAQPVKFQS